LENDSAAGGFMILVPRQRPPIRSRASIHRQRDRLFLLLGFLLGCFFLGCCFLAGATATSIAHFRILPFLIFESKIRQQGKSMYIKYNNRLKGSKKTKK